MLVDLIILATAVLAGVWTRRAGLPRSVLLLLGVGGGVLLGALLAPLLLGVDARSSTAAIAALPAAAVIGVLLVRAARGMVADAQRRRKRRQFAQHKTPKTQAAPAALERFGPPLLGACGALAGVWLAVPALARIDGLREPLRGSEIVGALNAALLAPGPRLDEDAPIPPGDLDDAAGPPRPSSVAFKADPEVQAAARSVVKLTGFGCRHGVSGSGWVARPGIVVTNAHVISRSRTTMAQVPGRQQIVTTIPIWFDRAHDIAILRVPGLRHAPALEIADQVKAGTAAAILGYPGGGPYDVQFARIGATANIPAGSGLIGEETGRRKSIPSTRLLGRARPGNSGGPVVDEQGRVLTMVFGAEVSGLGTLGIPADAIRTAMRDSGVTSGDARQVSTGPCEPEAAEAGKEE